MLCWLDDGCNYVSAKMEELIHNKQEPHGCQMALERLGVSM